MRGSREQRRVDESHRLGAELKASLSEPECDDWF